MTVYLSEYIDPNAVALLKEHATVVNNFDHIEDLDAIILRNIPVTAEMMDRAPKLKVIAKHGIGYNTIDIDAARERGIRVIYTPTTNADATAEMAVALFMALARKIPYANANCAVGKYDTVAPKELIGIELGGKTLGQIGMGNIGMRVAKILGGGFGCRILGYDPFISREEAAARGFEKVDDLYEMLEQADLVSIHVPLFKSTERMVDAKAFDHFKPSALFVNGARGGVVDEKALYDALVAGKLAAAALDTFTVEPPRGDNPLQSLPNFIATPHIGGNTQESLRNTGKEVVTETLCVLAGEEPAHPVV